MRFHLLLTSIIGLSPFGLGPACTTQQVNEPKGVEQDTLSTTDTDTNDIIDDTATSTEIAEQEPIEIIGPLPVSGDQELIVETLRENMETAVSLHGFSHLLQQDGLLTYLDETKSDEISLGSPILFDGAAIGPHSSVLALDGELFIFDGQWLEPSPFNDLLPVPIEKIEGNASLLWFQGANLLYRCHNDILSAIQPQNDHEVHLFAASHQGTGALAAPYLMLFDGQAERVMVDDYRNDLHPKSMTFDRSGSLWLSDGSETLYHRSAARIWSGLQASSPIVAIHGNSTADSFWIRTEATTLHHRAGVFHTVNVPEGEWLDVDEWGRILLRTESGELKRIAFDRTVAVSGLQRNGTLDGPTVITYAPTDRNSVVSLYAWVGQESIAIDMETMQSTLDSNDYPTGSHTLRILATGPEGDTITEIPFQIGELPDVKWENELQLITEQHCNQCHGEGSFLPLHTAGQWEQAIESIISEVVTNSMPKGGPYLSDEEIQMIRGWKNGGFQ